MDSSATYTARHGRWLATLVIGLLVLATVYSRPQVPAWAWGLPLPHTALMGDECRRCGQPLAAGRLPLSPASPTPHLPSTSAWYPVAQWLAAGDSPSKLATRLPEAGWPLASQAHALGPTQPQHADEAQRFAGIAKVLPGP